MWTVNNSNSDDTYSDERVLQAASPDVHPSHGTRTANTLSSFDVVFRTVEVDPSTHSTITATIQGIQCLGLAPLS